MTSMRAAANRAISPLAVVACLLAMLTIRVSAEAPATIIDETIVDEIGRAVSAGSADALLEIRSRISGGDAEAVYLRAYIDWRTAGLLGDAQKKQRKTVLKKARRELDEFLDKYPNEAELLALRGGVTGQSITGAFSGMRLGPKASRDLERAFELAPENPRVALLRGINFYYTPATFGGGKDKAELEMLRASKLFAKTDAIADWPNWGRIDVLGWLGQILAEAGKIDEATALYEEALLLDSDNRWILRLKDSLN